MYFLSCVEIKTTKDYYTKAMRGQEQGRSLEFLSRKSKD